MKGAILVIGGSKKSRENKINTLVQERVHPTEVTFITPEEGKKSIGIEQIRNALTFINKKPATGNFKALVITSAEKLTSDAQNALLKTLEEPPSYAIIVLSVKTENSVLPTVISRCQKVFADFEEGRGEEGSDGESITNIIGMSLQEKFAWSQEKAKEDKNEIIEQLETWIIRERENLAKDTETAQNVRLICEIKEDLEKTNVNTRLALDRLILHLK
jgi:DNA polymerase III delta prime subunit